MLIPVLFVVWYVAASRFLATYESGSLPDRDLDQYELVRGTTANRFIKKRAGRSTELGRSQWLEFKAVFFVESLQAERACYTCRYKIDNRVDDGEVVVVCKRKELRMNQKTYDSLPVQEYQHRHYDRET